MQDGGVEHSQVVSFTLSSGLWELRLPQRLPPGLPLAFALASERVEGDGVWHTLGGCVTLKQSSDGSRELCVSPTASLLGLQTQQ